MTVRLSRELRDTILTKALSSFMKAEKAKIEERRVAFGIKLYEHEFGAVEKIVAALPEIWRDMTEAYFIEGDGFERRYPGNIPDPYTLDDRIPLGRLRPFPVSYSRNEIDLKADHPLRGEANKLLKDLRVIAKKEDDLRDKIKSVLATCTTVKQLEAAWPEGLQFLPVGTVVSTALVPVGLSDQINKLLGIPSKDSVTTKTIRKAAAKEQ